jgi:very-short-patch-repair endonuclease
MANANARKLRKQMTRQEVKLWLRLRALRELGLHFRRQSPIGPYIVDFECRRARLVVELDGGQHGFDANANRDRIRDSALKAKGYSVLRFWNSDVDDALDGVLEAIVSAASTTPHPAARDARGHPPLTGRD